MSFIPLDQLSRLHADRAYAGTSPEAYVKDWIQKNVDLQNPQRPPRRPLQKVNQSSLAMQGLIGAR